jgi:hypothetical protein
VRAWLASHVRESLRIAEARPDFLTGLRAATATVLPLFFGTLHGQLAFTWMALGGWLGTLADAGGSYSARARNMAAYAAAGAVAAFAGSLGGGYVGVAVALILLFSVGAAAVRTWGEAASTVGTLTLVTLCVALGAESHSLAASALRAALLLLGVGSAMALSLGL